MKRFMLFALSLVLVIGVISCEKEKVFDQELYNQDDQKIINYIVDNYGFSLNEIEVSDDYIIVQGDMAYPKATFWNEYTTKNSFRTHYKQPHIATLSNIPIHLINVSTSWRNAIISAVNEWNSLNNNVQFNIVTTPYSSTITGINVSEANLGVSLNDKIAIASLARNNGYPGNSITINTGYTNGVALNTSNRKFTMVHELMHCLGFFHTDSGQGTAINNIGFWCNNFSDKTSVMRPNVSNWNGFSSCDKKAINELFN